MIKVNLFSCLMFLFCIFCLSSCSIQKRIYQPGFYIQNSHNVEKESASVNSEYVEPIYSSANSEISDVIYLSASGKDNLISNKLDTLRACVTILTTDKRELKVVISDMNDLNISYRLCDNPSGPVYSIPTNQVHKFNFNNNDSELYDLMVLKNGEIVKSNISEIDETSIKYKRLDNLNGPLYTIPKNQVYLINYKNGSSDLFNKNQVSGDSEYYVKESPKETKPSSEKSDSMGLGVTSLLFGIVGMFVAYAIPFGLLAILFGSFGLNKKLNGLAIAGCVLGLICIILGLMIYI